MRIALIGAGPRGLLVLERLIAWHREQPLTPLTITLFDPYPIGGRVWRRDQPAQLVTNTIAQHLTLFYDQTVADPGPLWPGPDMAQWAQGPAAEYLRETDAPAALQAAAAALGPNDFPPRALFGEYQRWTFTELQRRAAANVTITHRRTLVSAVTPQATGFTVTAERPAHYDAVVMALGTSPNTPTREQNDLLRFADTHAALYWPPSFPAEGDLETLTADDVVILRGLGLSFFDFMSRFTEGRGGHFTRTATGLTYHPSGREPRLVAGSRRGLPYHAKGRNQKAPGELTPAHFLTPPQLTRWATAGPLAGLTFWQALQHEVEHTYYSKVLAERVDADALAQFQAAHLRDPEQAVAELTLPAALRLDWASLLTPPAGTPTAAIKAYLRADIAAAQAGTTTGPLTSALEVLRDLRDRVRAVIEQGLLSDEELLDFFFRWFNGTNDFLSIGPPVFRLEQLLALIEAGVITILPPGIDVTAAHGYFLATAPGAPVYRGTALIEARVPAANAPTAQNPLLAQLLHADLATLAELQLPGDRRFQTGAVLVDRQTQQLLNAAHQPQGKLFFWGVPTEGVNWLTTASPRPFVNDVNLRFANRIARQCLA
ncbi:FAD/NAD(P)-binding protein [Lacticaseibacillus absianus]|uniref:FAD/NAD(P)-binding protein n=1 Tax=Lacticaseibacillus absianus TaxID=2729623 RepID=UPI0015C7BE42|nr:FAD/NAD(P)-binding protein [Lacticaseibacillus absianus]